MAVPHASPVNWRKSSYSGDGPTCVEVGDVAEGRAVRDSTQPDLGHLAFVASEWRTFVASVKTADSIA